MAIRIITEIGDEALTKRAKEVTKITPRLQQLLDDMAETMYDAGGVGLAAPQVGVLRRAIVVDVSDGEERENGEGLFALVNPEIVTRSGVQIGEEGCLSVPGERGVVKRPYSVTVRGLDRDGSEVEIEAEDFLARAFCHEIDHLNGRLYVDIMEKPLGEGEEFEDIIDPDAEFPEEDA